MPRRGTCHREPVPEVNDVSRDFYDVAQAGAVTLQIFLDLVVGVSALLQEISMVPDVTAWAVLILSANAGEIDEFGVSNSGDGHDLREDAFGPFTVRELFYFDATVLSMARGD